MSLVVLPRQVIVDINGAPRVAAQLAFYQPGTVTPITVYTTGAYGPTLTNPVESLGSGFFPAIYINPSVNDTYKLVALDADDAVLYTEDDIPTEGSQLRSDLALTTSGADGSTLLGYRLVATGSTGRTANSKLSDFINVRDFGAVGDGTDEHAKIQAAIDAVSALGGGELHFPKSTATYPSGFGLGTVGLSVPANVVLVGDASEQVILNYTGTGFAFTFVGGGNGLINAYVVTTAAAGSAFSFGNDCRRSILRRVTAQSTFATGSARTGTGLSLTTTTAATTFSGNMLLEQVYLVGYKFGIDFNCFEIALKTWTTVIGSQVFINGPGAGVCAGSRCIRMNATTNGVGSAIFGGTLEGCEAPIEVVNGGFGISYSGDIEGNTSDVPILGASWNGEIFCHPAGTSYRGGSNQTTNKWYRERHLSGVRDSESYFGQRYMVYNQNTANRYEWFSGTEAQSLIGGGSGGDSKFAVQMHPGVATGERNWIEVCGHKMAWGSATPTVNTWGVGDVTWNTGAAAGGSPGWVCTTGGTPGTWKAMANVAA